MFMSEIQSQASRAAAAKEVTSAKMVTETPVSILNIIATQNEITPVYTLIAKEGRVHAPVFTYQVQLLDMLEEGSGASKKKAKHIAARNMLKRMLAVTDLIEDKKPIERVLKKCDEEDIAEALAIQKATNAKLLKMMEGNQNAPDGTAPNATSIEPASAGGDAEDASKPTSAASESEEVNPIGKLQEICMKKYWHPPVYEDVGEKGQPHERVFQVECIIENMDLKQIGNGKSKKLAKRAAAQEMINKLRKENLDKVDELMDRLPRSSGPGGKSSFDLVTELMNIKKNQGKMTEDRIWASFYRDLIADNEKMDKLNALFSNDLTKVIIDYMDDSHIVPDVEKLILKVEQLLEVGHDISVYSEKREDGKFQVLGEFVAKNPKYNRVSILSTYGCDEDLEQAKKKVLSRCLVVLLCNIV